LPRHLATSSQPSVDTGDEVRSSTLDLRIQYSSSETSKNPETGILSIRFRDASVNTDSKSASSQVFMLADGVILHNSNKRTYIALSSLESEYMAMTEVAKEADSSLTSSNP
jgi:hypothetical protein